MFIRLTEPVLIIDFTSPARVRITSSETTLPGIIFSIVPASRFRMLVLIVFDHRVYPCAAHFVKAHHFALCAQMQTSREWQRNKLPEGAARGVSKRLSGKCSN